MTPPAIAPSDGDAGRHREERSDEAPQSSWPGFVPAIHVFVESRS